MFFAISNYLFAEFNSNSRPPALMEKLVKEGKLPAKTGGGFYQYSEQELRSSPRAIASY